MATLLTIVLVSQFIPWTTVFAFQKALSPEPDAAHGISLALRGPDDPAPENTPNNKPDSNSKTLPLVFRGLPAETLLQIDKSQWTLQDAGGKEFYSAADAG